MYQQENNDTANHMVVDDVAKFHLLVTAKWAKFLAVMGFIALGICFLAGIFMLFIVPDFSNMYTANAYGTNPSAANPYSHLTTTIMGGLYLVFSLIFIYPVYTMLQFSSRIKQGLLNKDRDTFNDGLGQLRNTYKFFGVVVIVYLCIFVLVIVFIILGLFIGFAFSH